VQPDERICHIPMSAGPVMAIDNGEMKIRFCKERIGEGHAHRACTDDQVVGLHLHNWNPQSSKIARG